MSRAHYLAAFLLLAGLTAAAQIHGTPASVTSLGPNGEIRGTPASVTSLGPFGWQAPQSPFFHVPPGFHPRYGATYGAGGLGYGYGGGYGMVLPYYAPAYPPNGGDPGAYGAVSDPYPGDPSAPLDPRAYAVPSAAAPPAARTAAPAPAAAASAVPAATPPASAPAPQPATEQDPTVLVFKDGHRRELRNYVIVGNTLYDLAVGHRRTIPLSDLDIPATVRANEERGSEFTLPTARGG